MLKKDLAKLLDISGAMVSRLAKQGMPVDTLERAQRWRKRHLEPGRVKGSRFDPNKPAVASAPKASIVTVTSVEQKALLVGSALGDLGAFNPDFGFVHVELLASVRAMLRQLPDQARPRLPIKVWIALVDWVLSDESPAREACDLDAVIDPEEFAALTGAKIPTTGQSWLDLACDYRDFSTFGLPGDDAIL